MDCHVRDFDEVQKSLEVCVAESSFLPVHLSPVGVSVLIHTPRWLLGICAKHFYVEIFFTGTFNIYGVVITYNLDSNCLLSIF